MVDRRRERVVQVEACGIACRIDGAKSTAPNRENTTASPGEVEVNPQPVTSNAISPVRKSKCVMGTPRVRHEGPGVSTSWSGNTRFEEKCHSLLVTRKKVFVGRRREPRARAAGDAARVGAAHGSGSSRR